MDSVSFEGGPGDLQRFASDVLKRTVTIDEPSPFEHRMRWDTHGSRGVSSSTRLRSGLHLSATMLTWERPWSFGVCEPAVPLKLMLGRGSGHTVYADGVRHALGGNLQVRRSRRALSSTCELGDGGVELEQLALEIDPHRLKELLGTATLPCVLEQVVDSTAAYAIHEQPTTPALDRVMAEIVHADARGASRRLFIEAKALELLARIIDELELMSEATAPFGRRDLERLECARRLLLDRMQAPPTLPALARHVGLNELKLKMGFRSVFGTSVFAYLRAERMEVARRLLAQRELSVTEIAARVGYANPSKFATAFRKHFGRAPSTFRA